MSVLLKKWEQSDCLDREIGPMRSLSDLSQLYLRTFACIKDSLVEREFTKVEWVKGVMNLVELCC